MHFKTTSMHLHFHSLIPFLRTHTHNQTLPTPTLTITPTTTHTLTQYIYPSDTDTCMLLYCIRLIVYTIYVIYLNYLLSPRHHPPPNRISFLSRWMDPDSAKNRILTTGVYYISHHLLLTYLFRFVVNFVRPRPIQKYMIYIYMSDQTTQLFFFLTFSKTKT